MSNLSFVATCSTPNAIALVCFKGVGHTFLDDGATMAQRFSRFDSDRSRLGFHNVLGEKYMRHIFARYAAAFVNYFQEVQVTTC